MLFELNFNYDNRTEKIITTCQDKKLVEGLSERELTNPEGAGFDLRLGEVYKISGEAFLGEEHRKTPDINSIEKFEAGRKKSIKIKPGDFYLVKTIEKINLPLNLSAVIIPRTTTFRSGNFHSHRSHPTRLSGRTYVRP